MASTSKVHPFPSTVPSWASFFSPREITDFHRMIGAELRARGLQAPASWGQSILVLTGGGERVDLGALARICHDHPTRRWPAVIARSFDRLLEARLDPGELLGRLRDFEAVRARIKVRIHAAGATAPDEALLTRPIAEGLVGLVVCDLDVANVAVPRAQARRWGQEPEALWSLAIENLRAEPRLQVARGPTRGDRAVDMLAGETPYASSHLLFFDDYFRGNPRYGALITVPHRHVILRHVIRDEGVLSVVPFLLATTVDAYECGPGPISTRIYWWRPEGRIELLPIREVQGAVLITPSRALQAEVLDPILRGG